jgi:ATP-dependent DNA helicase RecG
MDYVDIASDLVGREEEEWFEFKENWFNKGEIGMYISALSNAAAMCGKEYGYMLWGVSDSTGKVVGTDVKYKCTHKGEPFENYLARNLFPSIAFEFKEFEMEGRRMVLLIVPAAKKVPTSFGRARYGRIGSSIASLEKYPEREGLLWKTLIEGYPTMINTESPTQDLTFAQLKAYYLSRGLLFNDGTFKVNMHLLTHDGKYNMLACFLADNGEIPVRVSIFNGRDKSDPLFSVKEFGNQSLVSVIDRIIDYSDVINIPKAVEHLDTGVREDVPLFDQACFNEAVKNAFIHNQWLRKVAPMVTFFEDRIEITSFSSLAPNQTVEGFYKGHSIPVNEELSSIFLATHLSERTGKGNPLIVSRYGRGAFEITDSSVKVTLPYNWKRNFDEPVDKPVDKLVDKPVDKLSETERRILEALEKHPDFSQPKIAELAGVGKTTVQTAIAKFKESGFVVRVGSNKDGHWEILKKDN